VRDTDAGAQGHFGAVDGMPHGNQFDQLLRHPRGIFRMLERVQQGGELVPAHARDDVVGPHAGFQHARHAAEDLVASVVAERIVDALEAIQVDIENRHSPTIAIDPCQCRCQCLVEAAPVQQASQRIGDRLGFELQVQVAHHRHVEGDHHHRTLLARQWRGRQRHRQGAADSGVQLGFMQAVGFAAAPVLIELRFTPDLRHLRRGEMLEQRRALQRLDTGVQHLRNRRVGEVDQAILTHHQNALGRVAEHRGVEGPGAVQLLGEQLQIAPVVLMAEQGVDLVLEDLRIEGLENEIHRPCGVAAQHRLAGMGDGRDEDDRRIAGMRVAPHQPGDFEAIHAGHLHVQQHQLHIDFQQRLQRRFPRIDRQHLPVAIAQQRFHGHQVRLAVIDDQQRPCDGLGLGL